MRRSITRAHRLAGIDRSVAIRAKHNWNTQRFGNQTYYNGSLNGQPFNGNSQTFGNQTDAHFNSGTSQTNWHDPRDLAIRSIPTATDH